MKHFHLQKIDLPGGIDVSEAIRLLLDTGKGMAECELRKILINRLGTTLPFSTVGDLAKKQFTGDVSFINARFIFSNDAIVRRLPDISIIDIASCNRPLCEIAMSSAVVKEKSSLMEQLALILDQLLRQEMYTALP